MIFKNPSGEMTRWAGGAQMQRSQRRWPYGDKAEVVAGQRPLVKGTLTHQQGPEKAPPPSPGHRAAQL